MADEQRHCDGKSGCEAVHLMQRDMAAFNDKLEERARDIREIYARMHDSEQRLTAALVGIVVAIGIAIVKMFIK